MLGIIGGTGLTQLANLNITRRQLIRTPYGEPSGPLTFGELGGQQVIFLPRHGSGHTIAPHGVNYRANIWALHSQGVRNIVAVGTVGGIREDLKPGVIALPDQLLLLAPERNWDADSFYIHFVEKEDYASAAQAFENGANVSGAQPWMRIMAAAMRHRAGDNQAARLLWTEIYKSTEDRMVKTNALTRLQALRVEDEVMQLERIVEQYQQRYQTTPSHWWQLVQAGMLPGAPLDPNGKPYRLVEGKVEVSNPNDFPFVRKGLPEGWEPLERILPEHEKNVAEPPVGAKPASK